MAVSDHNRLDWCPLLFAEGKKKGVTVFPGLEISVNGCHLIGIWDANPAGHELAKRFLASAFAPGQGLFKDGQPRPVTNGQVEQVGASIIEYGGLLFAPHATSLRPSSRARRSTFGAKRLCLWFPKDPPNRQWNRADGVLKLVTAVAHLFKELYFRETGEWLGEEVHRDVPKIVQCAPLDRAA